MLLNRFWRSRSGNFALMLGIGLPAVLTAVAFALDVSTIMRAKTNLQSALDSANLAASHLGDTGETRQQAFDRYFKTNVAGHPEFANVESKLVVDKGVNYVRTKASAVADVNLNFAFLFGGNKRIEVDAGATESTNSMEVVLVLDNTGSMATNNRIGALRTAAGSLLDMLEAAKSPTRSIKVAVVPFVTAVNVNGSGFDKKWIDNNGKSSTNGVNFPLVDGKRINNLDLFKMLKTDWKGCVEARPGSYNISDTPPDSKKPDTLFVPYFAPDDQGTAMLPSSSYGNSATNYNNSYLDETVANTLGIDLSVITDITGKVLKQLLKYSDSTKKLITESGGAITVGPNRSCPTPITPLSTDFKALHKAVAAMREWNGSGTNVSEGLSWGMRVLSPGEPYVEGTPFKTPNTTKIVLLLTDGENVVYGAKDTPQKSDYGAYGYLASGRFGSLDQTTAARNVDGWTQDVCTQLKKEDVQIFTVLLQADTPANRKLYSACASSPENYFPTNDVTQLQSVFLKIGTSISKLHLTN